jgi:hydroxypyruvate isomerase
MRGENSRGGNVMLRFTINPETFYPKLSMDRALQRACRLGYPDFELWQVERGSVADVRRAMGSSGAKLQVFCTRYYDMVNPENRERYLQELRGAVEDAQALGCPFVITQVGQDNGKSRAEQHASILEGLKSAVPILQGTGVTLLVEPLNSVKDHIGYYLSDSREGFDLVAAVNSPCIRLLFDVYHQVHMGEDVLRLIRENIDLIAHIHVAGHPNRDHRIFQNFDYRHVFELVKTLPYTGLMGLELFPGDAETADEFLSRLKGRAF